MSETRRAGVLGHPIAHSLSPLLHRAAYAALGLPWSYEAYDVTVEDFPAFVAGIDETWAGLSVTMPLKVEALRHVSEVDAVGLALGVINTIVVEETASGIRLVGANTDVFGIAAALREAGVESVGRATLLGSGATATSAMAALLDFGCASPIVVARTAPEAESLLAAAEAIGSTPKVVTLESITLSDAARLAAEADVAMSTIPMEVAATMAEALPAVPSRAVLLDAVYDPPRTPLGLAWERAGGRPVSGVRMLLHQAGEQVRLMTGRDAPLDEMDSALVSHLSG